MAESPAHKFGQVIGGLLESVVRPQLEAFCGNMDCILITKVAIVQLVEVAK